MELIYTFTEEQKHSMLLEIAFYLLPIDLNNSLKSLASDSGITQSRFKQFIKEEAAKGNIIMEEVPTNCNSTKKLYRLPPEQQVKLLLEIRQKPASFRRSSMFRSDFRSAIRDFITDNKVVELVEDTSEAKIECLCWLPFYTDFRPFFNAQPPIMQQHCFQLLVERGWLNTKIHWDELEDAYLNNPAIEESLRSMFWALAYHAYYVYAGKLMDIPDEFLGQNHPYILRLAGLKKLYQGNYSDSVKCFKAAFKQLRVKRFADNIYNVAYLAALMHENAPTWKKEATAFMKQQAISAEHDYTLTVMFNRVMGIEPHLRMQEGFFKQLYNILSPANKALLLIVCRHYKVNDFRFSDLFLPNLIYAEKYRLLQLEASQDIEPYKAEADKLRKVLGFDAMLPPFKETPVWEKVLTKLAEIDFSESTDQPKAASTGRIVYLVDRWNDVIPVLQKTKNGVTWTAGRRIGMKTFYNGMPEMNLVDQRVRDTMQREQYGWYGEMHYEFDRKSALLELAGYPLVFAESNPSVPVVISKELLQLSVIKVGDVYKIEHNLGDLNDFSKLNVVRESDFSIHVVELTSAQITLLKTLKQQTSEFPLEAAERLTELIGAMSRSMTIHSDLIATNDDIECVPADARITVQLQPAGEGMTVAVFVKPLGAESPYCRPGEGNICITGTVEGRPVRTMRNLKLEQQNRQQLRVWTRDVMVVEDEMSGLLFFENPYESLRLLEVLQTHQPEVLVEWPQGQSFKLHGLADVQNVSLKSKGVGVWFELEGNVTFDENHVMKVGELLRLLRHQQGRYVQISEGEFVAISERLRHQLEALEAVATQDKKALRIPSIAAGFLSGFEAGGGTLKKDKALKLLQKRISEAETATFAVPEGLQAELRPYQVTGFEWMSRLTAWGAGACLADDMGLGKTVQTIALLLARKDMGASLVVMPTSVLLNWVSELQRFAPALNPIVVNDQRSKRKEQIEQAAPGDVLLTTYGILSKEIDALSVRQWNVIVLDEAHSIKNKETKMAKAALSLTGSARVMLTGTPLQNNLSELWTLFEFANPGLLNDYATFTEKFTTPIEKQNDSERREVLKQLLHPFILRRSKGDVLRELPEKTEITLRVELSEEESALYESLRREAIEHMAGMGQNNAIQALAEITKLRQAACNPALIDASLKIESSKTAAFCELVNELVHNDHRALVFSQFTSHLALIRKALDDAHIEYLYLDGSTPARERTRLVKDFQEGSTPLFLISLKAGGLGLNLTAADYVIHLDPWWNPAIEDQASDRAYRMGQTKPVTVYRLITAGTIEEKIIRLHETKKSLADSLLEGSNQITKISTEELLALLMEK